MATIIAKLLRLKIVRTDIGDFIYLPFWLRGKLKREVSDIMIREYE